MTRSDQKSEPITAVYTEWGDIFVTTAEHSVFCLHKLDLQTKLHALYEQKLFSVALTLAHNNNLYYGSIVEIHKLSGFWHALRSRYGDYLYQQGNFSDAVVECCWGVGVRRRYEKTIGVIEPSYVIRKFLDAKQLPNLTEYLEALHKQGLANSEHTTLLINCYSKLNKQEKLKEFVYADKDSNRLDTR